MKLVYLFLFGLLFICGCSGSTVSGPPVPITGKVSLKGAPLAGAMVQFIPTSKGGLSGSARTDESGSYQLLASSGVLGVPAGEYKVTISLIKGTDGKPIPADASPFSTGGKEALPLFYSKENDSILTATVPAVGPATIDFPLTGQGGAFGGAGGPTGAPSGAPTGARK